MALGSLLGGCASMQVMSHVPISTMSRLSSMTLADIDPEKFRVGARLPATLEPRPQGVKVKIDLKDGLGRARTENFVLDAVHGPSEQTPLAAYQRAGAQISIFRLSSADQSRLVHLMTEANGSAAATSVTISAGVDACHRLPLESSPLPTTTFLQTNSSGYIVLVEDLDLRNVVSERDIATKIPACQR